jgi:glycosyltransferase involved in cell wall biosynthesis
MSPTSTMRQGLKKKLSAIKRADIVIGLPSYNVEAYIARVIKIVGNGLKKYFRKKGAVIVVADGGSLDDTRENALRAKVPAGVERLVSIYRGRHGKGSAFRLIFQVARLLKARACAVMDSDLQNITPRWVNTLVSPVLESGHDFVAPYYWRSKYDATITNNLAYPFTRALYGLRIRQPIGGDFAFSQRIVRHYLDQDVWETDVARFGIDIWVTTTAINEGFKICQASLGTKVHVVKGPEVLGPMFLHMTNTMFELMIKYSDTWKAIRGSHPVETFGSQPWISSPPVNFSLEKIELQFREGCRHFDALWKEILTPEVYRELQGVTRRKGAKMRFPAELWAKVVYDFAYTFSRWSEDRHKLIGIMAPLYYGRALSFIRETLRMDNRGMEKIIERQAEVFERLKPYLLDRFMRWEGV